jgi:hypothetical protein
MRDIKKRYISEENSTAGRPKAFTHKWECFWKLRMYERLGTPWEVAKWKSLYERVVELVEGDDWIKQLVSQSDEANADQS